MEALLTSLRATELWRSEQALALSGECPSRDEVEALAQGALGGLGLRALSRHVTACPRCTAANFDWLSAARAAGPAHLASLGDSRRIDLPFPRLRRAAPYLAAAALLVAAVLGVQSTPAAAGGLSRGEFVDESGLQMRSSAVAARATERRALVTVAADGTVALVRLPAGAAEGVVVEPVEGGAVQAAVTAGEEVVLPLDHAVRLEGPESWFLIHRPAGAPALDAAALGELALRLARGGREPGVTALRLDWQ